jgi:hypothetical protein
MTRFCVAFYESYLSGVESDTLAGKINPRFIYMCQLKESIDIYIFGDQF